MKRYRLPLLGCLGLIVLSAGLIMITIVIQRGPYERAKSHWAEKGGADYTLVVSQYCFCGLVGEYKITVRGGRVTDYEPVDAAYGSTPYQPSDFDLMTAGAMLDKAARRQDTLWQSPLFSVISIQYDPTYGYVTRYDSDMNGQISYWLGSYVTDSGYSYTARDLVLEEP